jgi:hypothetical protein
LFVMIASLRESEAHDRPQRELLLTIALVLIRKKGTDQPAELASPAAEYLSGNCRTKVQRILYETWLERRRHCSPFR